MTQTMREQIDKSINVVFDSPFAPPGAMMSIAFDSDEVARSKLRERLRKMSDAELIRFGKEVRRLAKNPFQRQLEKARREWKRRKGANSR